MPHSLLTRTVLQFTWDYLASGTVTSSGGAALVKIWAYQGSGGAITDGIAGKCRTRAAVGSGTATTSGGAATAKSTVFTYAGAGGVVSDGQAATTKTSVRLYSGSGQIVTEGAATTSYVQGIASYPYQGSGEAVTSGQAAITKSFIHPYAGSGIVTTTGQAAKARTRAVAGSGSAVSSGAAAFKRTRSPAGSGGVVLSGAAGVSTTIPIIRTYAGSGAITTSGAATASATAAKITHAVGGARVHLVTARPQYIVLNVVGEYQGHVRVSIRGEAEVSAFIPKRYRFAGKIKCKTVATTETSHLHIFSHDGTACLVVKAGGSHSKTKSPTVGGKALIESVGKSKLTTAPERIAALERKLRILRDDEEVFALVA